MKTLALIVGLSLVPSATWAQTEYLSVSGSSMIAPATSNSGAYTEAQYTGPTTGAYRSAGVTPSVRVGREALQANIKLPQNATVRSMACAFRDPSSAARITAQLIAFTTSGGSSLMASVSTTTAGIGASISTTTSIFDPVINNFTRAYAIDVWITGTCRGCIIYNCKIGFER